MDPEGEACLKHSNRRVTVNDLYTRKSYGYCSARLTPLVYIPFKHELELLCIVRGNSPYVRCSYQLRVKDRGQKKGEGEVEG